MRAGLTLNQVAETETSEVVGHLRGRVAAAEKRGHVASQIAVTKTRGDMSKAAERLTECLNARVAEPCGDPHGSEG
jgi:hypothetical protein